MKLAIRLSTIEKRTAALVAAICVAGVGSLALADVPTTFESGEVLRAADLNANFAALDERIAELPMAAVTEWESYDPTVANLAASQHATTGSWRRVGDTIEVQIRTDLTGPVTSMGWAWSLPDDFQVDPEKFLDAQVAGFGYLGTPEDGVGRSENLTVLWRSGHGGESNVLIVQTSAAGNWYVGNGQSYETGTRVDFTARVPISGLDASMPP